MKKILFFTILLLLSRNVFAQTYSLDSCKTRAIENNYKLKNADIDVQISQQMQKEVFTKFFPSVEAIGLAFQANHHTVQKDLDLSAFASMLPILANPISIDLAKKGKTAGITAMQPVFVGGQIMNSHKLAKVGKEASVLQRQLSVDETNETTENYFWQIVSLKEKKKTVHALQSQLERLHKDVSAFVQAGVSNRNDLLRVELQQQELESNLLKIENGIDITKILLAQHIGVISHGFDIAVDSFAAPEIPLNFYVEANEAAERRIEYQLLDKNVEAKHLQTKIESGKRLPSVGVGAGYVYHDFVEQTNTFGMVFASLRVPISDWWGGTHAVKRAKLNELKAQNERQNAREMLVVEIQKTWNDLQLSYKQITLANKSIISASENLRLNRDYYNAGISPLSDLLDAQSLLQQSRDQYTEACADYQLKLFRYKQVTAQ